MIKSTSGMYVHLLFLPSVFSLFISSYLTFSEKHVKLGLLYIIDSVKSKRNNVQQGHTGAWRDAKLLEKAMVGAGTNDEALSYRCVSYLILPYISQIVEYFLLIDCDCLGLYEHHGNPKG